MKGFREGTCEIVERFAGALTMEARRSLAADIDSLIDDHTNQLDKAWREFSQIAYRLK